MFVQQTRQRFNQDAEMQIHWFKVFFNEVVFVTLTFWIILWMITTN